VKGDQANGALTDRLVDAKDARAPVVSLLFLIILRNDRNVKTTLIESPAGARADDKGAASN
jgi:hypothetical protein